MEIVNTIIGFIERLKAVGFDVNLIAIGLACAVGIVVLTQLSKGLKLPGPVKKFMVSVPIVLSVICSLAICRVVGFGIAAGFIIALVIFAVQHILYEIYKAKKREAGKK